MFTVFTIFIKKKYYGFKEKRIKEQTTYNYVQCTYIYIKF